MQLGPGLLLAVALLLTLADGTAHTLAAQVPVAVEVEPVTPTRLLAVGQISRFRGGNALGAGFLFQPALTPTRIEVTETGRRIEQAPRWYLHTLATAGVGRGEEERWRASAQLGVIRRNDSALITASGLAAQALLVPRALGPVARAEILDNLGVQAGWLFVREGDGAVYVAIDYMRNILSDLGLTR